MQAITMHAKHAGWPLLVVIILSCTSIHDWVDEDIRHEKVVGYRLNLLERCLERHTKTVRIKQTHGYSILEGDPGYLYQDGKDICWFIPATGPSERFLGSFPGPVKAPLSGLCGLVSFLVGSSSLELYLDDYKYSEGWWDSLEEPEIPAHLECTKASKRDSPPVIKVSSEQCTELSIPDCYRAANCQPIIVLLAPEDDPDTNQGCKSFEAVGCAPRGSCGQETSTLRRQDGRCFHYTTLCPPPGIPDLANQEHYDQESIDNGCLLNRYTGRYGPMAAPICADSLDRILNNPEGMEARKGQFLPYQGIFELNPFVLHSRTFGGTGQDIPVQVVENAAKDLLILAMEVDQDKVQKRTHLLVLQPDGEEKADYTLSDSFADSALSFALSTRGTEVIVFGRTTSPSPQSRLLWLLLVDTAGKVKWRKDFSGDWGNDTASFLVSENRDMTILASRDPQDDSSDDAGLCLFHTDGVGEEQWRTCFGTTTRLEESRDAMVETMDGYVVLGAEKAGDEAQPGILLTKISPAGQIVWSTPFHLPSPLVPKMLLPAQDHGFYVLAVSVDPVFPSSGIILLKFNQDGNAVWSRTIKLEGAFGDAFEFSTWDALSLHAAEDEELVLIAREQVSSSHYNAAETESMLRIAYLDSMGKILTSSGSRCSKDYLFSISKEHSYTMLCSRQERWLNNGKDIVLLSVDELGHVRIDHASYGSQQDDTAMSMLSQADGSLLIVGTTSDLGAGMSDIVLFRIGTHGRIVPLR